MVLGAAGGIGGADVRELTARGEPVRAVTRTGDASQPEEVEQLAADVRTRKGVVCRAAVAYHRARPPYGRSAEGLALADNLYDRAVRRPAAVPGIVSSFRALRPGRG